MAAVSRLGLGTSSTTPRSVTMEDVLYSQGSVARVTLVCFLWASVAGGFPLLLLDLRSPSLVSRPGGGLGWWHRHFDYYFARPGG